MALTQVDQGLLSSTAQYTGFKNRIINGAMVIAQRVAVNTPVTPVDDQYTVDRWKSRLTQSAKFSVQQSSTAPTGFSNSLLATSLSAYSVGASDFFFVTQLIEGFNAVDFAWGTASAATVTVSFWVRSSLTGAFGGSVRAGGSNRSYPFSYTISAANTWEQKSITVAGDTSGSWPTNNTTWGEIDFAIGAGSNFSGTAGAWFGSTLVSATGATSVVGTNGATFYITGVQLEKGSTATSFDYRPIGTELALCQRYYEVLYANSAGFENMSYYSLFASYRTSWVYKVQKRASASTALGSGASWINGTPTIYEGISASGFYHASTTFYVAATAGTIALQASAEL